eukprot:gene13242-9087_t
MRKEKQIIMTLSIMQGPNTEAANECIVTVLSVNVYTRNCQSLLVVDWLYETRQYLPAFNVIFYEDWYSSDQSTGPFQAAVLDPLILGGGGGGTTLTIISVEPPLEANRMPDQHKHAPIHPGSCADMDVSFIVHFAVTCCRFAFFSSSGGQMVS